MVNAFRSAGIDVTPSISEAISGGLKQIRREKYEERMKAKKARTRSDSPLEATNDSA